MKKVFTTITNKLDAYLRDNTTESSMRLYGLLIVVVGCVCVLAFTTFIGITLLKGKPLDYIGSAAIIAAISGFISVGIYGKIKQFKLEQDVTDTKDN